jgi:hypothetical protein
MIDDTGNQTGESARSEVDYGGGRDPIFDDRMHLKLGEGDSAARVEVMVCRCQWQKL